MPSGNSVAQMGSWVGCYNATAYCNSVLCVTLHCTISEGALKRQGPCFLLLGGARVVKSSQSRIATSSAEMQEMKQRKVRHRRRGGGACWSKHTVLHEHMVGD